MTDYQERMSPMTRIQNELMGALQFLDSEGVQTVRHAGQDVWRDGGGKGAQVYGLNRQSISGLVKRRLLTQTIDHRGATLRLTDKGRAWAP